MQSTMDGRHMTVTFDVHQYPLTEAEQQKLSENLAGLARQVEQFPVADLHVLIEGNARTNDVTVKLTLILPGTTLVVDDHDAIPQPAFDRSLDSLLDSLQAYKERLGRVPERRKAQKRTHQDVHPAALIDESALEAAVAAGDYAAFRAATFSYEDELRGRIGRWVQRYPEFDSRIGVDMEIADVVEDVFLLAFEHYQDRPSDVPFGVWLEDFVDPAVKALQQHPDRELENIGVARTVRGAVEGQKNI
jgi:ribosome-associated translation inhibitor RaiA